jgi:3-phosphoglycerate kinase
LRVDYNVDLDDKGKIISDFRIRASLPTINFLLANNAKKIIIISHLGRPKGKDKNLSLKPIAEHLGRLLKKEVVFVDDCIGDQVRQSIESNEDKKIFLLENLRFYEGEEKNDEAFAKELAKLADVYVNDAFGVCHRLNASVAAITKFLPSYAGLLLEKEVNNLSRLKGKVERPFVVVLGGAKISTKLPVIKKFLEIADYILLGGGLANTVCEAWGFNVGKSLVEKEMLEEAKALGSSKAELILPGDFVVAFSFDAKKGMIREMGEVKNDEIIVDIGPVATKFFVNTIKKAKTILWNGPMGYWENKKFREGTEKVAKAIAQNKNFTVVGGGETLTVVEDLKLFDKYSFVSTGGGAMLEFLSEDNLSSLKLLE